MAESSRTQTTTLTTEQVDAFYDREVRDEARRVLSDSSTFWSGVEWVIDWLRNKVKDFFANHLANLPVVGKWAGRIGLAVTEFIFTVIGTMTHFLKIVFCAPKIWNQAHAAAMIAWTTNEPNGLLAQTYAYGKKMAAYFLEIIKQCFERAIKAHGLEVSDIEKNDISAALDDLLD